MSIHIKSQKGFERHQYRTLQKKEERKNKFNVLQAEALSSRMEISSLRAELAKASSSRAEISSFRAELAAEVSKRHDIVDNSHRLRQENQQLLTSNRHHQTFEHRLQRDVEYLGAENYHLKRERQGFIQDIRYKNIILITLFFVFFCWILCRAFDLFSDDDLVF
jgi:hypothetical protein